MQPTENFATAYIDWDGTNNGSEYGGDGCDPLAVEGWEGQTG